MRVIDISNVISMPYAGGMLADLGAEVIKIERTARPDTTRMNPNSAVYADNEPGEDPWNRTGTFNVLNRGKKSLTLDLSQPAGRDILRELIQVSDILTENFTPRVMRGWGLDYPNAAKLNPNLIMLSCSGYGREGPLRAISRAGHDDGSDARAGARHRLPRRRAIESRPVLCRFPGNMVADDGSDAGAALPASFRQGPLGRCRHVSTRLLHAVRVKSWTGKPTDVLGGRIGNRHPWLAPQGCYRCAGDDAWCVVSVQDDDGMGGVVRGHRSTGTGGRSALRQPTTRGCKTMTTTDT